jgi:hypothetical protein
VAQEEGQLLWSNRQDVDENTAAGINKMFNNLGDPVFANLQRVALLAMQGRQSEAAGRLQTVIKGADPAVQKKIIDAVNNIKPVTINGRVADSSTLDKSKQHNDWIINTFIPWVQSLLGQQGVAEEYNTMQFAAEKTSAINPYGGRKDNQYRGAMSEASGYIPSEKQKNDPRFKTALTVDVHPDTIKKNAKAFYWNTSRAGIPPTAKANGKIY